MIETVGLASGLTLESEDKPYATGLEVPGA